MKIVVSAVLLFFASAMGQSRAYGQSRVDTIQYPTEKVIIQTDSNTVAMGGSRYAFNPFWSNWFIGGGVGAQVFFGNQESLMSLGNRVTPTYEGSIGKWVHPIFGVRYKMGGGEDKSYTTGTLPEQGHSLIVGPANQQGVYTQRWHHLYGELDALVDLNNAFGQYIPDRRYTAVLYLGAGLDFVQNQPKHDADRTAIGVVGLMNRFRITDHFDANLEIKDALVKQTYDREITGRDFESYAAISVGVVYRIGHPGIRPFTRDINYVTTVTRSYRPVLVLPVKDSVINEGVIKEVIVDQKHVLTDPVAVFFDLDKAEITPKSRLNLAFIAEIIKKSGNAKFILTGSADSKTGSAEHNRDLSVRRSRAVRDYLVQILLVEPDQLLIDPVGGIDRFKPYDVNRAVIIREEQTQP